MPRHSSKKPIPCLRCGKMFRQNRPSARFCSWQCFRSKPDSERFWGNVDKTDSCWIWTACRSYGGYGQFRLCGGTKMSAHRFSWELHFGKIPDGLCVCHNCPGGDNPSCVNPTHLWLGTEQENIADRCRKGRTRSGTKTNPASACRGEKTGTSKLKNHQVICIKERLVDGDKIVDIANDFNVTVSCIYFISQGRSWKHIKLS